eukprot:jgi/Mesen1/5441/ME000271S04469
MVVFKDQSLKAPTSFLHLDALEPTLFAQTDPLTTPYEDCFKWKHIIESLQVEEGKLLYAVVFRSVRKESADTEELYAADAAAYEEARQGGGLLKYWYGTLNKRRECLATCIWESREAARGALGKAAHVKAMQLAAQMYYTYTLERYWIRLAKNGDNGKHCGLEFEQIH